jgi:hypothetical protein
VIEGASRYLVQDRMGRTGARWSLAGAGAEAIIRLRALRASGDFDDYWRFHLAKDHERTHRSRYVDSAIPNGCSSRFAVPVEDPISVVAERVIGFPSRAGANRDLHPFPTRCRHLAPT